jgi:hypothetical protein
MFVKIKVFNMSDDSVMLINGVEQEKDVTVEFATSIMHQYFGVKECNCGDGSKVTEKPANKNARLGNSYWGFPENSEFGLSDCGKVIKGGTFMVNKAAILAAKPYEKPKTAKIAK